MSSGMSARVSRKLSNCKKWRRAGDLKSWHGSGTVKGGRREIKVRVREVGGSDPPCAPTTQNKLHQMMLLLLPILVHVMK